MKQEKFKGWRNQPGGKMDKEPVGAKEGVALPIQISLDSMTGRLIHNLLVGFTDDEFVLDCIYTALPIMAQGEAAYIHIGRFNFSPEVAKRFASTLNANIATYEQKFGFIETGGRIVKP